MDKLFGIYGDALSLRQRRLNLIASNIANAGTPNYKARDIDFKAAIKDVAKGKSAIHAAGSAVQWRQPLQPSIDGNSVDLSIEQTQFTENAIGYRTALSFSKGAPPPYSAH